MMKALLRQEGYGRMVVMIIVCIIALAPVSCRMLESDQGGIVADDPCAAATALAEQFVDALDQWNRDAMLSTLMPEQRILARATWAAESRIHERQNADIGFDDLSFECQADDGPTVTIQGTVVFVDLDTGAETQRIEDWQLELSAAQQGDAWYLLADLPDIMQRLRGE